MSAVPTRVDWRLPKYRRDVFHDFYEFHLRHGAHPGVVYGLMPYLRAWFDWDDEQALWFAFLNGNTQNPLTSLLLHRQAPTPKHADRMLDFWQKNFSRLAFDTDRRYHKKNLAWATGSYLALTRGGQKKFWDAVAGGGWPAVWQAATTIPSFGRLSAFSYAEYLRITDIDFDCDDLMLEDRAGSRSHRNGLCIVLGLDSFDWHDSNPGFDGHYPNDLLAFLKAEAGTLLREAKARAAGKPWERDVSYFTLESTFCTYKSWHRPNRRYAGVYLDMLHDRIKAAEAAFPDENFGVFWQARADCLPEYLRLEDRPTDPGVSPLKQNWYRDTGEVIVLGREYPAYWSEFDEKVDRGDFGTWR